jgi:hypothetical protein
MDGQTPSDSSNQIQTQKPVDYLAQSVTEEELKRAAHGGNVIKFCIVAFVAALYLRTM